MDGKTDGELMELVRNGDKAAFEALVLRHRAAAEQFAHGIVRDSGLCEDIVQDCFVKLWLYREKYRPDFAFRTFFYTLVKRRAADELRKRRLRNAGEPPEEIFSGETPESIFIENEIIGGVYAKIEQLRRESGDCLYLFAVCGMRTRDIAGKLGISEVNVRVRIHRERARLKKLLEKEEII